MWITHPQKPLLAYFRKTFWAPARIQTAWIQIGAPFSFDLYVNGRHVGAELFKSANAAILFDITRYLQPGQNTIAIYKTLSNRHEIILPGWVKDKRKLLRNAVLPEIGLHIFNQMKNQDAPKLNDKICPICNNGISLNNIHGGYFSCSTCGRSGEIKSMDEKIPLNVKKGRVL